MVRGSCLLGYVDTSDSVPWRELFPEFEDKPEYSVILQAARESLGSDPGRVFREDRDRSEPSFEHGEWEAGDRKGPGQAFGLNSEPGSLGLSLVLFDLSNITTRRFRAVLSMVFVRRELASFIM